MANIVEPYFVAYPITEEQHKFKQRIEKNLSHDKPLKRTILTAFKNEELKYYICSEIYVDSYWGDTGTLLYHMLNYNFDININIIELIKDYSNFNYINTDLENSPNYNESILSILIKKQDLETIKKYFNYFQKDILIYNNLIDDLINNKKLSALNICEIIQNILRVNPLKTIKDITCNGSSILTYLTIDYLGNEIVDNIDEYIELYSYLIEVLNCDVNEHNGRLLKVLFESNYFKFKYNKVLQLEYIKLFVENGYNLEQHNFYDFYIHNMGSSNAILDYINTGVDRKIDTIFTSEECSVCYEKYDSAIENKVQVALIPCGHTICNGCYSQILIHDCPLCRMNINSKIIIK